MGRRNEHNVPEKANKILNGILVVLILIAVRAWHLAVVQHEEKIEESLKPQQRVVIEQAERATICDRFGIPLAINKVQYNASISYGPIREIPRSIWHKDENGKRVKVFFRKEYITRLTKILGEELHLDPGRIEDIIYSKAAILGNVPCVIKENISESAFFRLKMLEKEWPAIHAEIAPKRCYPQGAIAGEVIGYIGPISKTEYQGVTEEMRTLREWLALWEEGEERFLPDGFTTPHEVALRLIELEKRAYTINDFVGKVGAEAAYDQTLSGRRGKHVYLSDIRGNLLRELSGGSEPQEGKRLNLSLSIELQAYAEQLLAEYDQDNSSKHPKAIKRRAMMPEKQPWIKGGAIVAMNPMNGEIYTLATFPRFDPNDFIRTGSAEELVEKNIHVNQWLESETHLANIWNLKVPLTREKYLSIEKRFDQESLELSWDNYLNLILPATSPVKKIIREKNNVEEAVWIQRKVDQLVSFFASEEHKITHSKVFDFVYKDEEEIPLGVMITLQERAFLDERFAKVEPEVRRVKEELQPFFSSLPMNYEKLLLVDLYRIALDARRFTPLLTELLGPLTISEYREISGRWVQVSGALKEIVKELFNDHDFRIWREEEFKDYLAEMREAEKKAGKKYARPYIEYLDHMRQNLFNAFWETYKWDFTKLFLSGVYDENVPQLSYYIDHLRNWAEELKNGVHSGLDWTPHYHRLQALTQDLDPPFLTTLLKTIRSFEELDRPLLGSYSGLKGGCEKHLAAAFYPTYGFGYARSHAFRQAATIGSIFKLVPAYEALRQRYMAGNTDLNPLTIVDDKHKSYKKPGAWNVGFNQEGKVIPIFYRGGRLPRSEHAGIGKVDIARALETSSNPYFSLLAGDILEDPEDLLNAASLFGYGEKTGIDLPGEYPGKLPKDITYNRSGLYSMAIGQHSLVGTPLQAAVMFSALTNGGEILKPKITQKEDEKSVRWTVFYPPQIEKLLLSAMQRVVKGEKGTARILGRQFPASLVNRLVGKTSTAEAIEKVSLDGTSGKMKIKHVWFGAVGYEDEQLKSPELVVIVYLRYGEFGKDATPLAAKIFQKWHELKSKYEQEVL